jgi:hypothetical protein
VSARQTRPGGVTHGARSPAQIKQRARAHRRRFLRQSGLRARDCDAILLAYVEGWARACAKIDAYDAAELERDPREYHAALNSARLWLAKVEARMKALGIEPKPRGAQRRDDLTAVLEEYDRKGKDA